MGVVGNWYAIWRMVDWLYDRCFNLAKCLLFAVLVIHYSEI